MFATIEHYENAGRGAAIAHNQGEKGRYNHYRKWWADARFYESDSDRKFADEAFDRGWKEKINTFKINP